MQWKRVTDSRRGECSTINPDFKMSKPSNLTSFVKNHSFQRWKQPVIGSLKFELIQIEKNGIFQIVHDSMEKEYTIRFNDKKNKSRKKTTRIFPWKYWLIFNTLLLEHSFNRNNNILVVHSVWYNCTIQWQVLLLCFVCCFALLCSLFQFNLMISLNLEYKVRLKYSLKMKKKTIFLEFSLS